MSKKDWKNIFILLGDLMEKHHEVVICMVLQGFFVGVRPFIAVVLTGMLVDAVYAGADMQTLFFYAGIGVGSTFLFAVAEGIMTMFFNRKLEYMQEIQGEPLNRKSMAMDYEYLEDVKVHEMRQRIERFGGWSLTAQILSIFSKLTTSVTTILVAMFVVLPMFVRSSHRISEGFVGSWLMSVLFLVMGIVLVWCGFRAGAYFNKKVGDVRKTMGKFSSRSKYYLDILSGYDEQKDLRICRQRELYNREFAEISQGVKESVNRMSLFFNLEVFSGQTLTALTGFLVYVFASILAAVGIISIGSVVTYSASILRLTNQISQVTYLLNRLKTHAAVAGDYVEYMNLSQRKYEGTIPMEKRQDDRFTVEFDRVSFKYPGTDIYVIKDLSLKFEIGEKMAIVGKNGSGKTTFIKLLCRLYDVTEGAIKVNGIDIRKYDYAEYCALFAVVFQDFQVFSFPLGENLAAGFEVEKGRAVDALERAGLGDRYRELPNGLDTSVGKEFDDTGVTFSGGETQKIAIARAIYKNAPFVIMDEPTAALDPESECEVYAGFDKMVGYKTALYISHRLASCRFCEDILVFDQGQVVQRGSHEELEEQEGLYRELWNAQAQYYA